MFSGPARDVREEPNFGVLLSQQGAKLGVLGVLEAGVLVWD